MSVRNRNASAWLLPNDGTRTPHALRRDMRRFDDTDEVDMVVIGCGAGGGVLTQRLAEPAGGWWPWTPVRSGIPMRRRARVAGRVAHSWATVAKPSSEGTGMYDTGGL